MMYRLYNLLLILATPLLLLRLLWRSRHAPDYRRRIRERFGALPSPPNKGGIWLHAVSVGEVQAAEPLIRRLLRDHPEWPLTLTTTTPTGSARARLLFGERLYHSYCPYDLPFAMRRFLDRVAPRQVVLMETEIWPNLLIQCQQRGIPTLLANARLSARSARGYARLGDFTRKIFAQMDRVAVQSAEEQERFIRLGVLPQRIQVTGSMKFDMTLPPSLRERGELLKFDWQGRPVWVAGSTHAGEEEQVIAAHREILQHLPNALLVLVPRHPERFAQVAALVQQGDTMTLQRRSSGETLRADTQVLIGDSMGELLLFFLAADAAFVGGSLVERGGHNLLEPLLCGLPVAFGPYTFNFAHIAQLLQQRGAGVEVADAQQLARVLLAWLRDATLRAEIAERGTAVMIENRGAVERLYQLIVGEKSVVESATNS